MKKLQDNLTARIAASVILTVSFLLTLLSTAGIVLLASYQAYNDGGAQLRTSYLHAAGVREYYDHVEPVLEGLVHEPQSYQNYLNSLNVHVDVKTTDGTTVFSNAKEGETSLLEGPLQLYVHDRRNEALEEYVLGCGKGPERLGPIPVSD